MIHRCESRYKRYKDITAGMRGVRILGCEGARVQGMLGHNGIRSARV